MESAIRKAKDSLGNMFDKNLHDLVRGIRNHKDNEQKYIRECIEEIKQELKQNNIAVKANAINKLCYLEMLGYDISWAAFNIIEVMSSSKFTYKRIGYLAASQSFHENTEVLMLTTNMIRKDLGSQNMFEAGIALSGLSCFLSPDLARDLANEIMTLMTSSKPYIRKKAVLIMYKIFLKYPDALRPSFPRLKEKLDDTEPSVQAAAVNVICELARKNPKNYLSLAPIFFKLMTVSTNNWVLIKIIKLFGALTPLEPRLGQKLIEPLTNLINSTSAMSLLYECINTVLAVLVSISSGQPNHNSAIQICLQKLRILIEDSDQNLKYLGLLAMSKILQTNPKSVQTHKDLIMQCLDDKDESIRLRSLDLLYGMVSKKNLMEIIKKLMVHMNKAEGSHYRDELLAKIVDICSQNNYQHVTNFEWYVSVLVELTRMEGTRHGKLLSSQMLDVAIRVESIRPFIVAQMAILLDNIHVFTSTSTALTMSNNSNSNINSRNNSDICEVLYAATWICGEFAVHLSDPNKTLESMLKSKVTNLPGHIQSSFVQNIFKLYSLLVSRIYESSNESDEEETSEYILSDSGLDECKRLTEFVSEKIQIFEQNPDIEVQERACTIMQILKYFQKSLDKQESRECIRIDLELKCLIEGDLNPVAPKAQKKVPVPEGLDLEEWINDPPSDQEESEDSSSYSINGNPIFLKTDLGNKQQQQQQSFTSFSNTNYGGSNNYGGSSTQGNTSGFNSSNLGAKKIQPELSEEDLAKYRETRKVQIDSNPFYIKSGPNIKKSESNNLLGSTQHTRSNTASSINESVRSQSIDLKIPINIPGVTSSDSYYRMTQIDYENKKLKKKMKNKVKKGDEKKKKGKRNDDDEDDDDLDAPVVKVLANEMPEGAVDDSDDDRLKKRDPNDPHRALDINLDEPLNESYKLPVPVHRSLNETSKSSKETKEKKKVKRTSSIEKKTKKKSKKENGEIEKDSKKEKPKKKKKEKENESEDLLSGLTSEEPPKKSNDYSELLSPDQESIVIVDSLKKLKTEAKNENNDIDFWLSTSKETIENSADTSEQSKQKTKKTKSSKTNEKEKNGFEKQAIDEEESLETNEHSSKKEKKEKKEKKDKKEKEKKRSKNKKSEEINHDSTAEIADLDVEIKQNGTNNHLSHLREYRLLASNKHMRISYLVKPNHMNLNQIIVNIKIANVSNQLSDEKLRITQIYSIELNILDTNYLKLVRDHLDIGSNETIKIPFVLNVNTENELEYLFNINDCTFSQKLKGTLTYMIKSDQMGSQQEKVDFKLNIPCSSFLVQNSCDNNDFAKSLGSGQLNSKYSIKLNSLPFKDINSIVNLLCSNFYLSIVEIVDSSASLYSSSLKNHPICILVKLMIDQTLTIDAKSTSQSLIENLLNEFKETLLP